jgi:hypothetical protein
VGGKPLPGWSLTIPDDEAYEDGWSTDFRCTVYGYLRMGMPNQLLVYASEEDLENGAAPLRTVDFIPVMDGNRETEIELGNPGVNVCHVRAVLGLRREGVDITIEGGVVYLPYGRLHIQVKRGERIAFTAAAEDGGSVYIYTMEEQAHGHGYDYYDYDGYRELSPEEFTIVEIGSLDEGFCVIYVLVVDEYTETPVNDITTYYDEKEAQWKLRVVS